MSEVEAQLYGRGIDFPLRVVNGRLAVESGSALLWGAVESVLETEAGSAALDPYHGYGIDVYETIDGVVAQAAVLGEAIGRDPRLEEVEIEILEVIPETNTFPIRITITPVATRVPESRVYPYFGLA